MYFHHLKCYDNRTTLRCPNWTLKSKIDKSNFWKNNFYIGTMPNYVGEGSTMTHKFLLGSLMIFKKNFSPYLAFFACQKNKERSLSCVKCWKIVIFGICKVTPRFWHLQTTCASELTRFLIINHIWSSVTSKISVKKPILMPKRPENSYFGGTQGK